MRRLTSISIGLSLGAVVGVLAAAILFLGVLGVLGVRAALADGGSYYPEPAPTAEPAPAAPPAPVETMTFSQQQTIVRPTEIRIGPGIACRMDDTVLACSVTRPAPRAAE